MRPIKSKSNFGVSVNISKTYLRTLGYMKFFDSKTYLKIFTDTKRNYFMNCSTL